MTIKNLVLGLETIDTYFYDGGYIGTFEIDHIHRDINRYAQDSVIDREIADFFCLEIHKNADGINDPFFDENMTEFECIANSANITDIHFDLVDMEDPEGTLKHYDFGIGWDTDEKNPYHNLSQKAKIGANGNLYLVISDKDSLEDIFPDELINSDDEADRYSNRDFGYPLLAILDDDKFRILRFSNEKQEDCILRIGNKENCFYHIDGWNPYETIKPLLHALQDLPENYESKFTLGSITYEFFTDQGLSCLHVRYIYKNYEDKQISEEFLNLQEFVQELIAEIQEDLDFWSGYDENRKISLVEQIRNLKASLGCKTED